MIAREQASNAYEIEVFYDGECPLCRREISFLRQRDQGRGRIRFTDIADPAFRVVDDGITLDTLMAEIHGRLPDGEWVRGVEVFRRLYAAIGFGPVVLVTRLPGVSHFLGWAYQVFARNRLRWTGRCQGATCTLGMMSSEHR